MNKVGTEAYIKFLEEEVFEKINVLEVNPLLQFISVNSELVKVYSKIDFTGSVATNPSREEKRFLNIVGKFKKIIAELSSFEDMPISESMQANIYRLGNKLLGTAIEYGLTDEACNLMKILKNENIIGDYSKVSAKDSILKVIKNHSQKESIIGEDVIKSAIDQIIVDVKWGYYGDDVKTIDIEDLDQIYTDARKNKESSTSSEETIKEK